MPPLKVNKVEFAINVPTVKSPVIDKVPGAVNDPELAKAPFTVSVAVELPVNVPAVIVSEAAVELLLAPRVMVLPEELIVIKLKVVVPVIELVPLNVTMPPWPLKFVFVLPTQLPPTVKE